MRKLFYISLAACMLAACSKQGKETPATDRLLGTDGAPLAGIEATVVCDTLADFPGMVVRRVEFVNTGSEAVTVAAMETSRIRIDGTEVWSLQPTSTAYRKDWVLPVEEGFYQRNYLGMNDPDYGGGIPMICLWTAEKNLSVGIAEPKLRLVSMPVSREGNETMAWIRQDFDEPVVLAPGESLSSCRQFVLESTGDFFNPLRTFAHYMQETFNWEPPMSPEEAYEPSGAPGGMKGPLPSTRSSARCRRSSSSVSSGWISTTATSAVRATGRRTTASAPRVCAG